jgi:glycosyltransferase involved in cell wall biosynthesis
MKALFVHDHYYYRDGRQTLSHGQYHHSLWGRYLSHFDALTVVGRDGGVADSNKDGVNIASCDGVSFELFPNMNSIRGLLSGRKEIASRIDELVADHDVLILRGISELGIMAHKAAKAQGKYVAFEIVSCAFDELWFHGSIKAKVYSPLRFFKQRQLARHVDAVIYVSQEFLQRRYPTKAPLIARASNVHIPDAAFHQKTHTPQQSITIGMIGTLKNRLKGVHVAIDAVEFLKGQGIGGFTLHILGPGDPEPFYDLIREKGLQDIVFLYGIRESGEAVWQWLRGLGLYIQPSFQEGVPRATIEAMAQGLPVIGSDAGGLPELLNPSCIVKRGNAPALAYAIKTMMNNPQGMRAEGERNFQEAQKYHDQTLSRIRNDFWSNVRYAASQA